LTGEVEDVDGEVDVEKEAEQILAFVSAKYPQNNDELKQYYSKLFYQIGQLRGAINFLTSRGLIVKKDNRWYVTPLGRAISASFLDPEFGYQIAKKSKKYSIMDIAIEIAPLENIYLSRKVHARLEQAMKTHLSSRFLSDSVLDIVTGRANLNKLPGLVIDRIKEWNKIFFDCKCKENPYCLHPQLKVSKLVLNLRLEGLKPNDIAFELRKRYDLFVYPGDLLNWLDEIIHASQSVGRLAQAMKDTEIYKESKSLAFSIENARYFKPKRNHRR
jgi:superfamily II helicase